MVISCVAFGCQNRQADHLKFKVAEDEIPIAFHRFPANKDMLNKWIRSVKRWKWNPTRFSFICSEHFLTNDYKVPPWDPRPRLYPNIVPSIFNSFPENLQEKPLKERSTRNSMCTSSNSSGGGSVAEASNDNVKSQKKKDEGRPITTVSLESTDSLETIKSLRKQIIIMKK